MLFTAKRRSIARLSFGKVGQQRKRLAFGSGVFALRVLPCEFQLRTVSKKDRFVFANGVVHDGLKNWLSIIMPMVFTRPAIRRLEKTFVSFPWEKNNVSVAGRIVSGSSGGRKPMGFVQN